jgi:hypothetical protein
LRKSRACRAGHNLRMWILQRGRDLFVVLNRV